MASKGKEDDYFNSQARMDNLLAKVGLATGLEALAQRQIEKLSKMIENNGLPADQKERLLGLLLEAQHRYQVADEVVDEKSEQKLVGIIEKLDRVELNLFSFG